MILILASAPSGTPWVTILLRRLKFWMSLILSSRVLMIRKLYSVVLWSVIWWSHGFFGQTSQRFSDQQYLRNSWTSGYGPADISALKSSVGSQCHDLVQLVVNGWKLATARTFSNTAAILFTVTRAQIFFWALCSLTSSSLSCSVVFRHGSTQYFQSVW